MSLLLSLLLAAGPRPSIEPAEVRDLAQDFANCAVKREPELASAYVLDSSLKLDARQRTKLFHPGCVPSDGWGYRAIRGGRTQMSFALAESLVRLRYPSAAVTDFAGVAPLDHSSPPIERESASGKPWTAEALADLERSRSAYTAISILGECVVRANPSAAHGLLLTEPGSSREDEYLAALQPAAAACVEKGAAITLTKYSLRGTIALNYYRLANAPRLPGATQ